jgi:hypothetical protein
MMPGQPPLGKAARIQITEPGEINMIHSCSKRLLTTLIIFSLSAALGGCATIGATAGTGPDNQAAVKNGPPAHAPAYGYRAKYQYRYYPACSVYFDIGRKMYFFLEGDHWRISAQLPDSLRVQLSDYVVLEMDTDRPYLDYEKHRQKYPPGKLKNNKNAKWIKSI